MAKPTVNFDRYYTMVKACEATLEQMSQSSEFEYPRRSGYFRTVFSFAPNVRHIVTVHYKYGDGGFYIVEIHTPILNLIFDPVR